MIHVKEVMTLTFPTIDPRSTVKSAGVLLLKKKVTHLPVVVDGRLVGIVAREDIIRGLVE